MNIYVYIVVAVAVVLLAYLIWLSKHFVSFAVIKSESAGPLPGRMQYQVEVLIHNREKVPLTGAYCIIFGAIDGQPLHLTDQRIYCGDSKVSEFSDEKEWRVSFSSFPAGDTWGFEFTMDSDQPVKVELAPLGKGRGRIEKFLGVVGQSSFRIKPNVTVDFYPTNKRPTATACLGIVACSLLLGVVISGFAGLGIFNSDERDQFLIVLSALLLTSGIQLWALSRLREYPAPISRCYSVPTSAGFTLAKPNEEGAIERMMTLSRAHEEESGDVEAE